MANLAEFTGRCHSFRGKSNSTNRDPDIFQNIKVWTLADYMTDTVVTVTVIGRRYFDNIQQVGIAVDVYDSFPVPDELKINTHFTHIHGQSFKEAVKTGTFKIKAPVVSNIVLLKHCQPDLLIFFAVHYLPLPERIRI